MNIRGLTTWTILLVGTLSTPAWAEVKAPSLIGLFPQGASRGKTVTVSIAGDLPSWPINAWLTDGLEQDTGLTCKALETKGKLQITVPPDARPGTYWLRLYNQAGASSPRPFLVSDLPDAIEKEPNNSTSEALRVEKSGVMVHGRLEKKGDVDSYAIDLEAKDLLVADLLASRVLGSPMDGSLQIVSSKGFVLAENDDDQEMDPRLIFQAPKSGSYIIRIFSFPSKPNSSIQFSGENAYIYRLALTTGPFIEHAYPLAIDPAAPSEVILRGWNIPEEKKLVRIPAAGKEGAQLCRIPGGANAAPVVRESCQSLTEEQYGETGKLTLLDKTLCVSGLIASPGERDSFIFSSPVKESIEVSIIARKVGSLLDPVVVVRSTDPGTVIEKDDSDGGLDCSTLFTPEANKSYRIEVTDRFLHGGQRFFYMLRIARPVTGFSLKLAADSFIVEKGKKLEVPITVERHGGYKGKILIAAADLPEGIRSTPVESIDGKESAKAVKLIIESDSAPLGQPFRIFGEAGPGDGSRRWAGYSVPGIKTPLTKVWLTAR